MMADANAYNSDEDCEFSCKRCQKSYGTYDQMKQCVRRCRSQVQEIQEPSAGEQFVREFIDSVPPEDSKYVRNFDYQNQVETPNNLASDYGYGPTPYHHPANYSQAQPNNAFIQYDTTSATNATIGAQQYFVNEPISHNYHNQGYASNIPTGALPFRQILIYLEMNKTTSPSQKERIIRR